MSCDHQDLPDNVVKNLGPDLYRDIVEKSGLFPRPEIPMGIKYFMKRLKKTCPWLEFGYFNPYRGRGELQGLRG